MTRTTGGADLHEDFGDELASDLGATPGEQQLGQSDQANELVHGNPGTIRASAAHLKDSRKAFDKVGDGMRTLDSSHWKGEAADTFREKFAMHPTKWLHAGRLTMRMNVKMTELTGGVLPQVRGDDVPASYRAIVQDGWIVGEGGALLLVALYAGYSGSSFDTFEDVTHYEATVNGRGMMDYDLPSQGPGRVDRLLRRSLAYACLALRAALTGEEKIMGYVSMSEGGLSGDIMTGHVTFCVSHSSLQPYLGDIQNYTQEALLEVSQEDALQLLPRDTP
ncbi:putative T7SS-secreted protein [Streptomyces griseus]|uniref:putative T7SS-secreted protein n=1 Tax=Streptomyces griseus TaxID=1911 RepID=UPI002D21C62A|nr:hypothetical protein [Streptomyces griseus]